MSILLQQALKFHQAGDFDNAQSLYEQFLQKYPNDVNGLQLLGSLHAAKENFPLAISLMERSLEQKNDQPQVMLNLAIACKRDGQIEKAEHIYRRVLSIQPKNIQAYQYLLRLLTEAKLFDKALKLCEEAVSATGQNHYFDSKKADLLTTMQRYDESIQIFQSLLVSQPNTPEYIHGIALALRQKGEPLQALGLYEKVQAQGVSTFQLFHNMGNALSDLGRLDAAISYYEKSIELNPGYIHSHINLNELLWETGQKQRFLASYLQAIPLEPRNMPLKFAYCQSLLRTSNYDICLALLEEVEPELRVSSEFWDLSARAEKGLGNIDRCLAHYQTAIEQNDSDRDVLLNFAQALIEARQVNRAQKLLEEVVGKDTNDQFAWSLLGICWRLNSDPREHLLNDYENLVGEFEIDIPPGFNSVDEFCQQLNQYLTELHTGTNQPLEQTLTGGTQTRGNLFDNLNPLVQALEIELRKCIAKFIEISASFEYVDSCKSSQEFEFSGSWSVQLQDKGFHTSHIHPMGWLSSAFYVSLPSITEDCETKQGWFCLGKPNIKTSPELGAVRKIQPSIGKLVLFRSYMWHSTTAFESAQNRTTVAFDVIKNN
ncbi:2OG-Fe(II) oxygenase family protein [Aliiglaciecola sp. M165]|uniref:2OG-Fe(II) oxygenase family protein n=1 Tax=Aliiglaciecola sp. M165 TaxID=2593649 RepID=UPI00117C7B52|nr:tetratricopeptide repeat protein [Aliiglaciecola sp. M165]TRY29453.1 tetratricopeptide repeat protein [Aliiglaciecola sp. M165]